MTKLVTFKCNLCSQEFPDDAGTGVYFIMHAGLEFKHVNCCEKHLCNSCLEALRDALKAQEPPRDTSWDNFKPGDVK